MAEGDIGALIDSLTWEPAFVGFPFISHLHDNLYILSRGNGAMLYSIFIDNEGGITPIVDTLNLDGAGVCGGPKYIRRIDGDVYAVARNGRGAGNNVVETFTCDDNGIFGAVIDTEVLSVAPPNIGFYAFLLHATGNIYIVAYTDNADDGWIKTLRINNDGSIDPFLDSWECEADRGRYPWLIHISGDMYAIMISASASNRGKIRTFSVNAAGAIPVANIAEWIFEGNADAMNGGCIVPISAVDNTYALFWAGVAATGQMATCTITPNGWVNGAAGPGGPPIDTWNHSAYAQLPFALAISGNEAGDGRLFAIGQGTNGGPHVWTLEILNTGVITKTMIDTLTLVPGDFGYNVTLLRVSLLDKIIFGVTYQDLTGAPTAGDLDTFEVEGQVSPVVTTVAATGVT